MSRIQHIAAAAVAGVAALVLSTALSAAQQTQHPTALTPAPHTTIHTHAARTATRTAHPQKQSTLALAAQPAPEKKEHHLILQVNTNDPAAMNLALNNATNVTQYYKGIGESVKIEVVTFGPGLHMLRDDTSPVKARIETMALSMPEVSYKACGNTQENMRKAENKDIPIMPQAEVVNSGVIRIMQLQESGWTYIKP